MCGAAPPAKIVAAGAAVATDISMTVPRGVWERERREREERTVFLSKMIHFQSGEGGELPYMTSA